MNEFLNGISNREFAILFWGFVFFGVLLILSKNFKGLFHIIKHIFSKILIYYYIFISFYISLIYVLISKTIFWENYLMKDFVFWCIGFALISLFNSEEINSNDKVFKKFKNIFSLTILTDFFINFFNFKLGWELVLIPILSLIGILKVYTDINLDKNGYKEVNRFLNNFLSLIGIFLLAYCIYNLYINFDEISNKKTINTFLLPVILSVLYYPMIIFFACSHKYQKLFFVLNSSRYIDKIRIRKIKIAVFIYGNLNLDKLEKIKKWDKYELQNNSNIFKYISQLTKKNNT